MGMIRVLFSLAALDLPGANMGRKRNGERRMAQLIPIAAKVVAAISTSTRPGDSGAMPISTGSTPGPRRSVAC
jgi:hypothetical protein